MAGLADELFGDLVLRTTGLKEFVLSLRGSRPSSRTGLYSALTMVADYPDRLHEVIEDAWHPMPEAQRLDLVRSWLLDIERVTTLVEEWFAHGTEEGVPPSLARAVE